MEDILGKAIWEYWNGDTKTKFWVHDHIGPKVEMKRSFYFREWKEMPTLEQIALQQCKGKILDVGAGAGAHSLVLQQQGKEVYALDISPLNEAVMKARSVHNVFVGDFYKLDLPTFDTLLFIMNGVGISGTLAGFESLLSRCKQLLHKDGRIIMDSSDLSYLYDKETPMPLDRYYGEIDCAYSYKGKMTDVFTWLYLDFELMQTICDRNGWHCEQLFDDGDDQFLVSICLK